MATGLRLRCLLLGTVLVAILTLLNNHYDSQLFFYLLVPGAAVSLLITGGHGSTHLEEAIAPVASFTINALAYSLAFIGLFALRSKAQQKQP